MLYRLLWVGFLLTSFSTASFAGKNATPASEIDANLLYKNTFSSLSKEYSPGYCERLMEDPLYAALDRRVLKVIAWEELARYMLENQKTITKIIIGDINVYSIGRDVNQHYLNAVNYATRRDVQQIIANDLDNLDKDFRSDFEDQMANLALKKANQLKETLSKEEIESLKANGDLIKNLFILAYKPIVCPIYATINDPGSVSAVEFKRYFDSVIQRAFHKNTQRLSNALENLDSFE